MSTTPIAMTRNPADGEFDARLSTIIKGLNNEILNGLRSISKENASIIVDYISAMITEINPSDSYKGSTIHLLYSLSKYNKNKSFRSITRDGSNSFLNARRKPESSDPLHKWIGTYNLYRVCLSKTRRSLIYTSISKDTEKVSEEYSANHNNMS